MSELDKMTSRKPHLLRAMRDWILENHMTPYILVNAAEDVCQIRIPRGHIKEGHIVLNLGPLATHRLEIGSHAITFEASFSGEVMSLYIPLSHVEAIYARENGRGMPFGRDEDLHEPPPSSGGKPRLTIVSNKDAPAKE